MKHTLLVCMIMCFLSCDKDNSDDVSIANEHLIAYYTLDNEAKDKSDNDHDGHIIHAGPERDRNGELDKALEFNGYDSKLVLDTFIDDHLSESLTFSAWIKYRGNSTARILSNYNGEGIGGNCNERIGFVFGVTEDRRLNIFYAIDGNDYIGRWTNENTIELDRWMHVAGTWNGTYYSNGFKLYINGKQADVANQETGWVYCGGFLESSNPFYIGMGHCAIGECAPFRGSIDDVRIYAKELSASEITVLSRER